MNKQRKRISLKSLSPARQALIVCMHEKQFGTIRNIPVVDCEPVLQQATITRRRSLTKLSNTKPLSRNYFLKTAHLHLLELLDEIQDGNLEMVKFREGLPCLLKVWCNCDLPLRNNEPTIGRSRCE